MYSWFCVTSFIRLFIAGGWCIRFCPFGNAPVQSCKWSSVLAQTKAQQVLDFYHSIGEPVKAQDLRLYVAERSLLGSVEKLEERDEQDAVLLI
jgi:hypothetical protein